MSSAVMRHHGGDGGADPPRDPTHIEADCERVPAIKRRGINKGISTREARAALGRPLPLEWDVRGKTYKEIGEYSHHLSREIGLLIRQYVDPDYDRWDKVPKEVRDRIFPRLQDDLFDIGLTRYGAEHRSGILLGIQRSCADRYSEWKNDISTHIKKHGRRHAPDGLVEEKWKKALDYFDRPEVKRRSEINAANRAKQKQNSFQGSQSTPALRYKKRNMQTGHLSGVPETWMDTKYKEGRGWEKLLEVRQTQQTQSSTTTSNASIATTEVDDIALVETVFGRRRGHQTGLGRRIRSSAEREVTDTLQPPSPPPTAQEMRDVVERLRIVEEYMARLGGASGSGSSQPGDGQDPTPPTQ
ncbi:uncharacterized protein LOC133791925 [Humulus lupulus]|uniref:uncharacterized protein LOC133791925 n=1 Tax=Humulus lupulus TaxID=3486 RepID=UPI002B407069|nr:uncharacterized protein LOC133791925 [Humulus lupulus]